MTRDTVIKASCVLIAVQLDSTGLPLDCYRPDDCSVRVVCVQTDMWTVQDGSMGEQIYYTYMYADLHTKPVL